MSSNSTISPAVSNNDSTYTFNELAPNTSYNVIVTVIYNSGINDSQVFNELTRTRPLSGKFPNKAIYLFIQSFILYICETLHLYMHAQQYHMAQR